MLTLPAAWHAAYRRSVVTPIVLVRLYLDLRRVVRIYDYTQGGGDSLDVGPFALIEGVDFSASTSNSVTAALIAQAFNAQEDALPNDQKTGVSAFAYGEDVYFMTGALSASFLGGGFEDLPIISSDEDFAAEIGEPPEYVSFVSGDSPELGYPCCITGLATASMSLDPFTRATTVGSIDIEFGDDGQALRELVLVGHRLYLSRVEVLLGVPNLLEGNFALMGTYVVSEIVPEPGKVTLQCKDAAEEGWKNRTIRGSWVGRHPLQIVEDIFVNKLGADDIVDLTTLDPVLYDEISHFVVSRYHDIAGTDEITAQGFGLDNAIIDDRNVMDVLEQLLVMCGGCLIPDNTGLYGYRHFRIGAPVLRTWRMGLLGEEGEGFDCDLIEVTESVGKIANYVKATFAVRPEKDQSSPFALGDRQAFIAFGRDVEEVFDLLFCNGFTEFRGFSYPLVEGSAFNATNADRLYFDSEEFCVPFAGRQGFCGARWDWNGSSFDLADGCTLGGATGRYCILQLQPPGRIVNFTDTFAIEYIAIGEWQLSDDTITDDASVGLGGVPHPSATRAIIETTTAPELEALGFGGEAVVGRGGLGSTVPGEDIDDYWGLNGDGNQVLFGPTQCIDVTIPIAVVYRTLQRFRFGAPRIRTRTSLEHMDLEIGDFVSILGDDLFIGHRRLGLDAGVVWEIVGKNVDVMADSPGIVWDLAFVSDTGQPTITAKFDPPVFDVEIEPVRIGVINYADGTTVDGPPTAGSEVDFLRLTTNLIDGQIATVRVEVSAFDLSDPTVSASWTGLGVADRAGGALSISEVFTKAGSGLITNDPEFSDVGGQFWLRAVGTDSRTLRWHASIEYRSVLP